MPPVAATIDAIYEEGRLRLLEPVPLQEGEHVRLRIERTASDDLLGALDDLMASCADLTADQWRGFDEASARRDRFFREPSPE